MENLLEINNLIVSFENPGGELTAVKGVSLSLAEGETLALVGESGCGKTVLCKSMLKILCSRGRIRRGEILLSKKDLVPISDKEMRNHRGDDVAMVFQDPMTSLDPAFSVGEQIAEVLRIHKGFTKEDAKTRAIELMELVQIDDAAERYGQRPYQFSGGMRQRIVIAIALAAEPKLLLADEPTTALDEETQKGILRLLKYIQIKTGVAILFITHDLSIVEDIADRVAIMQDGIIVEEGKVSDVFSEPKHLYTKKLLGYLDYNKGRGHNHRSKETDDSMVLSVKNLSKSFEINKHTKRRVFDKLNLDIYSGEIVGLVGPSGCGKSTLARCIIGLEKPDSGTIEKNDIAIQMIFQDSQDAFNDRMTVEEIIAEPLRIMKDRVRSEIRAAVAEVMKAVELDENLAKRKPYQLSGGQRQRVAIARALIARPDMIIADEPLTGLDVSAQAQIVHLFKKLQTERNLTILLIAHDLPMVNHVSNRVVKAI